MKVRNAMHEDVQWVSHDVTVTEVAKIMRDQDIGALPVCRDGKIAGMITDRDITIRVTAEGEDPDNVTAAEMMSPHVVWCRTEEDLEDAIHLMDQKQIRRLPVIDDAKKMVGMLSLGDISHAASRELSGEILHAVSAHHGTKPPTKRKASATQPTTVADDQ